MNKLYILVRKDLSASYRSVQAGHAVAEWVMNRDHTQLWTNGTLVYLGVEDETDLLFWCEKLNFKNMKWVGFREPDIGNQLTAIACLHGGKEFSKLKLI